MIIRLEIFNGDRRGMYLFTGFFESMCPRTKRSVRKIILINNQSLLDATYIILRGNLLAIPSLSRIRNERLLPSSNDEFTRAFRVSTTSIPVIGFREDAFNQKDSFEYAAGRRIS